MTKMTLLAISPPLRRRTHATPALSWSAINKRGFEPQLIGVNSDIGFLCRLIGVGYSRLDALLYSQCRTLVCITQNSERLVDVLASDHVDHETRLLRRPAEIFCACSCFHLFFNQ